MRLIRGVEAVRNLAEGEVIDVAADIEGPAAASGEAEGGGGGGGGGGGAGAARAQDDLGLGDDEGVGGGLDGLEQQAEHEEGGEAGGPLGARARLQRRPEGLEELVRLPQ